MKCSTEPMLEFFEFAQRRCNAKQLIIECMMNILQESEYTIFAHLFD